MNKKSEQKIEIMQTPLNIISWLFTKKLRQQKMRPRATRIMMFCKSMIVLFSNSKVSQKGRANKKEIEI
jgi:hypothetical protein